MKILRSLAVLILGILMAESVTGQYQVAIQQQTGTMIATGRCVITTDGGIISDGEDQSYFHLSKFSDAGDLLWRNYYSGASSNHYFGDLIRDEDGGCLIARANGFIDNAIGNNADTARYFYVIGKIGTDGQLISSWTVERTIYTDGSGNFDAGGLRLAKDGAGNIFLITYYGEGFNDQSVDVIKMSPTGELVWARNVGRALTFSDLYFPTTHARPSIAVNAQGEVYLGEGTGTSQTAITKLASNGDLLWAKAYNFTGSVLYSYHEDLALDQEGVLNTVGIIFSNGPKNILTRVAPDGGLLNTDLYSLTSYQGYPQFLRLGPNGERISLLSEAILVMDTMGSPGEAWSKQVVLDLPYEYYGSWYGIDVLDESVGITGNFIRNHIDLNVAQGRGAALKFDSNDFASCIIQESEMMHIPVPQDVMQVQDISTSIAVPVGDRVTITNGSVLIVSTMPVTTTTDLCSLTVGFHENGTDHLSIVRSTVVGQGLPIILSEGDIQHVEVRNLYGALISSWSGSRGVPRSISTTGWATGIYLVRALDRNGRTFGVSRVAIQ